MSNETERQEAEKEIKEMEKQLMQEKEAQDQAKAVAVLPEPSPEPVSEPSPVAESAQQSPVTQESSEAEKPKDDPMEWAKKKGFKSPEDMARALLQKEQEFHKSRQKETPAAPQQPSQPAWAPGPDMNGYGFQPQPQFVPLQPRISPRDFAPYYPQLAPEDVERMMPLVIDAAEAISNRKMAAFEQRYGQQFGQIQRTTERNNELMTLMQDPAFRDERVQREIHAVLDSEPSLFNQPGAYSLAYEKALANMTRKQLHQGVATETTTGQRPPVTAGGGNGSASTSPRSYTPQEIERWSIKDQEAFINSGGRIVPKK